MYEIKKKIFYLTKNTVAMRNYSFDTQSPGNDVFFVYTALSYLGSSKKTAAHITIKKFMQLGQSM